VIWPVTSGVSNRKVSLPAPLVSVSLPPAPSNQEIATVPQFVVKPIVGLEESDGHWMLALTSAVIASIRSPSLWTANEFSATVELEKHSAGGHS
jgi:hypothetical protein